MNSHNTLFSVARVRLSLMAIVALALITGCSSGMSRVQTWEGSIDNAGQVAVISAPGAINVREVNGRPMTTFLVDDLAVEYELIPGENRVVFNYKTIWSKAERVEDGESKVHIVETPRQTLTLNAEPGETYRFDFEKPGTRQQAEALAQNFSATLVDSSGQAVATSSPWAEADSRKVVTRTPVPDSGQTRAPADGPAVTTLEQLKALWGDASEEEKREFLRWAFE